MIRPEPEDLIVLVADKNQEYALHGLLGRTAELGVRPMTYQCRVHPNRDPGCLGGSQDFLRPFLNQFRHAVVVLDHEGSGREQDRVEDLERQVEDRLQRNGWDNRACAVVIHPELETWVWSDLPVVEVILGWKDSERSIRTWLSDRGYWADDRAKPNRPKEAVEEVLRMARKPRSSAIYRDIARRVEFRGCTDRAFRKLLGVLHAWFPPSECEARQT